MRKFLLLTTLAISTFTKAQTTIFSENFEGGVSGIFFMNTSDMSSTTSGINDWVVNNAYTGGTGSLTCLGFPFTYTVSNTAPQPAGITGSPNSYYMHIRSDEANADGINCSSFTPADGLCFFPENNFTKIVPYSTAGYFGVEFSFWWACGGEPGAAYGELYYSIDGGITWILISSPIAQYQGQSTWIQQTISMPAFDNQMYLSFGFRFVNGTATAPTEPGFQIDDVKLTGNACTATGSTLSPTICQGDSYFAEGANQTVSGTYYDTLTNSCGEDSIITTNLTVSPVDISLVTSGITLTANASSATYQWINCGTMTVLSGETNQNYTATANGSYAVIVTQGSCSDTSNCINITSVGMDENYSSLVQSVSPNPFTEQTTITINTASNDIYVLMTDATGRQVTPNVFKAGNKIVLSRNNIPNGVYFLQLNQNGNSLNTIKLVLN